MDDFLLQHAPGRPVAIAGSLREARGHIRGAAADLIQVPDGALEAPWPWRGEEADVRNGFYRTFELLEVAEGEVRASRVGQAEPGPAVAPLAANTAARWDLHGLLAGIGDDALDKDPGGGEWTVRQTLAHIVNGQRAYGWFTAWWHSRRDAPADDFPSVVPDDVAAQLPDESTEAPGSIGEIGERLDAIVDLGSEQLGGLDEEGLAARARWSGMPVTVRFRLGRWSSHMREHTIQVEKTMQMLGQQPTEVERLVRLVLAAYGRLEASAFLLPEGVSRPGQIVEEAAREARTVAAELREAASAAA
jgi:uncharacterized damage-inducible protein DinB